MRPLIGITCGTEAFPNGTPDYRDRLNAAYSHAVWQAGGQPVTVPNLAGADRLDLLQRLDGLLVSGGDDIHPSHYGEEVLNDTVDVDAPRDSSELPFLHHALESDLPLLCICRGLQSLNVVLGGTLWQDQPSQRPSQVIHKQTERRDVGTHPVRIESLSRLAQVVGDTSLTVNSFHHQAIRDLAPALRPVAFAEDGIVEAVELTGEGALKTERFVIGVQFHPEEMVTVCPRQLRLFEAFVSASTR